VQFAFVLILIGALGVGLIALGSMGWRQYRRRSALERVAHEMGMKFSTKDPFDLTRRYPTFVLTWAGHSPCAENVIHGRYKGWNLRAFDYRYEAGHGPGRLVRRYSVVAADTDLDLPAALMWRMEDASHVPMAVQRPWARLGPWLVVSGGQLPAVLTEAFGELAGQPVSVQIGDRSVLLCSAVRWQAKEFAARMDQATAALGVLHSRCRPK
jgi:hypothetical protein